MTNNKLEVMTIEKFEARNKTISLEKMSQAILGQSKERPGNIQNIDKLVFATEVDRERYLYVLQAQHIQAQDNKNTTEDDNEIKTLIDNLEAARSSIRTETKEALKILQEVLPKINAGKGTAADAKVWQDAENKLSNLGRDARMKQQAETLQKLSKKPTEKSVPEPTQASKDTHKIEQRKKIIAEAKSGWSWEEMGNKGDKSQYAFESKYDRLIYLSTLSDEDLGDTQRPTSKEIENAQKIWTPETTSIQPPEKVATKPLEAEPRTEPKVEKKKIDISDTLKDISLSKKGYKLQHNSENNQVQLVKNKRVISYFTEGTPENAGKKDATGIQSWAERRISAYEKKIANVKEKKESDEQKKKLNETIEPFVK